MPDVNQLKRELRSYYRQMRDSLSADERRLSDEIILNRLNSLEQYKRAAV